MGEYLGHRGARTVMPFDRAQFGNGFKARATLKLPDLSLVTPLSHTSHPANRATSLTTNF